MDALTGLFEPFMPREMLDPLNKPEEDPFASDQSLETLFRGAGADDVEVHTDPLPVEFDDVEAWRRWTMSTGQRMFWGHMDDDQRADVLSRAEKLLEGARGYDGRVVVHTDVRYTLARI
jgi:hypothetical protein